MQTLSFRDDTGNDLCVAEDAGTYFSPNNFQDTVLQLDATFKARPDDVLVITYPKSGTHWSWEINSMLVHRSLKLMDAGLVHLEYRTIAELDAMPSPRVIASHLPFHRIPTDFLRKRCKIVCVVRNPGDVAVSFYNYIKDVNVWDYDGPFDSFFKLFLEGKVPYNSWFEHIDGWLTVAKGGRHNLHMLTYDGLHTDFRGEIGRLADFLGVDMTSQLMEALEKETAFSNMKVNKIRIDFSTELTSHGGTAIYREGLSGNWLNKLNEDQVKLLEEEIKEWRLAERIPSLIISSPDRSEQNISTNGI